MKRLLTLALAVIACAAMAQKNPIAIKHYDFLNENDSSLYATSHLTYNNGKLMEQVTINEPYGDTAGITRNMYDAQGRLCYTVQLQDGDTISLTTINNDYAKHTSEINTYSQSGSGKGLILVSAINEYGVSDYNGGVTLFNLYPCDSFSLSFSEEKFEELDMGVSIEKIWGFPHKNNAGDVDSIPLTAYINMGFGGAIPMNLGYIHCEYDNRHNCTLADIIISIPADQSYISTTTEYDNNDRVLSIITVSSQGSSKIENTYNNDGSLMVQANYSYDEESWDLETKDWYEYELSINEADINVISCYPNPTRNMLNIQSEQNGNIYVYDINGRQIMNTEITAGMSTIDMQNMAAGCYMVKFICNTLTQTIKVIKK